MTTTSASSANGVVRFGAVPEPGQLVEVRRRQWVVTDVSSGALSPASNGDQHLVGLSSLDEDSMGEEIQVVWQMEAGAQVLEKAGLRMEQRRVYVAAVYLLDCSGQKIWQREEKRFATTAVRLVGTSRQEALRKLNKKAYHFREWLY